MTAGQARKLKSLLKESLPYLEILRDTAKGDNTKIELEDLCKRIQQFFATPAQENRFWEKGK